MERFLDFQFKKEVRLLPLFFNESLRAVAISLLSLFSSVYIYKTIAFHLAGELSPEPRWVRGEAPTLALSSVFIFFLSLYVFKLIANLFAEELSLRLGLKKQIWIGLTFLAFCLLILVLSLKWPLLLFLASPFWGLSAGFYWFGRHGLMVKLGHDRTFGKELGMSGIIGTTLLLGVPFLGGVLVSLAGYKALFLGCLVFVFLSGLTVGSIKEEKTHQDTTFSEVLSLFRVRKKMFLAYFGDSVRRTIYAVAIPLYLFLILKRELSLGEFFSLSMILIALINLLIGRWVDIKGKKEAIGFGAVVSFLVWLGRVFTQSIGVLVVFDVAERIATGMTGIPMEVLTYEKALGGRSTGRAVLFREVALGSGSIFACFLLLVLALLGIELRFSFLLAGVFSLLPLLITGG